MYFFPKVYFCAFKQLTSCFLRFFFYYFYQANPDTCQCCHWSRHYFTSNTCMLIFSFQHKVFLTLHWYRVGLNPYFYHSKLMLIKI